MRPIVRHTLSTIAAILLTAFIITIQVLHTEYLIDRAMFAQGLDQPQECQP